MSIDPVKDYYTLERSEMVKFVPKDSKKVLEIGCGYGGFTRQLKEELSAEFWGVEINEDVLKHAEKIFDKVLIGDISQIIHNLPDSYFDCIVFNDVLEHLPYPEKSIQALRKKCVSGAYIVCSIPNVRHYQVLLDLVVKGDWKYTEAGILDKTHLRFFTKKSIIRMFQQLNCKIHTVTGINSNYSKKYTFINWLTFGFFRETRFVQFACVSQFKVTE